MTVSLKFTRHGTSCPRIPGGVRLARVKPLPMYVEVKQAQRAMEPMAKGKPQLLESPGADPMPGIVGRA